LQSLSNAGSENEQGLQLTVFARSEANFRWQKRSTPMSMLPPLRMYPRKQLDIGWFDLARAACYCASFGSIREKEAQLDGMFAPGYPVLAVFTVRTGFDLCLGALGLPAGSEILMTALTILEMANIAKRHGLVPIPLDIEDGTMAPEISTIEAAITGRTRAIVVAHLFGLRVPMGPVIELAKKHGLIVFEDCAQALPAPTTQDIRKRMWRCSVSGRSRR
jgi:dTDP-4-amino-4,6-dideoxygalactose transaminase